MDLKWIRRIESIEDACAHRQCYPCVYPNCQRYVREQMVIKRNAS